MLARMSNQDISDQDIEKYTFSLDFEEEEEHRQRLREERRQKKAQDALKQFTQDDVDRAREKGIEKGRTAAEKEFNQAIEHTQNAVLDKIAGRVDGILGELENQRGDQRKSAITHGIEAAIALFKQVAPDLAERNAEAQIESLIQEVVIEQTDRPRIVIHLHPDMADALAKPITTSAGDLSYDGNLTINADNELALPDVRIDWGEGGIERRQQAYQDELVGVLRGLLARLELPIKDPDAPGQNAEQPIPGETETEQETEIEQTEDTPDEGSNTPSEENTANTDDTDIEKTDTDTVTNADTNTSISTDSAPDMPGSKISDTVDTTIDTTKDDDQ